jgi:hypothetical protein
MIVPHDPASTEGRRGEETAAAPDIAASRRRCKPVDQSCRGGPGEIRLPIHAIGTFVGL